MITQIIADIISDRGVTVARIAEATGISNKILYSCFDKKTTRELRGDELVKVCRFLDINPLEL